MPWFRRGVSNVCLPRNAPASVVAPFRYFGILTSFGFGSLFFGDFPVDKLFPGVVLLIASGTTLLWRERHQNTEEILTLDGDIKNDIDFLSLRNSSQISESYSSAIGGLGFMSTFGSSSALAKSSILLTAFISKKTAQAIFHKIDDCDYDASKSDNGRTRSTCLSSCFVNLTI